MPKIGAQFDFRSPKANFKRDQYDTLVELKACTPEDIDQGHIAYCNESNTHYIFNPANEFSSITGYWTEMSTSTVETGDTAPEDTKKIWVDTSSDVDDPYGEISELKSEINRLRVQVNQLTKLLAVGIKAGDSTIGGRTMLASLATPVIPWASITEDDYYNEENGYEKDSLCVYNNTIYYALADIEEPAGPFDITLWTTECPDELEPFASSLIATVPNISIKMDTTTNFKRNYVNLIDGELIFCTDLSALYIYRDGRFIAIGSSSGQKSEVVIEISDDGIITVTDDSQDSVWTDGSGVLHIENIGYINDNNILEITTN